MTADRRLQWLADRELALWLGAIVCYGVGDTITTYAGLSTTGVAEVGPVAGPLMEAYGRHALLAIKGVTLAFFYVVWRLLARPVRAAVPLALVVVGGVVTVWNLVVIATAGW